PRHGRHGAHRRGAVRRDVRHPGARRGRELPRAPGPADGGLAVRALDAGARQPPQLGRQRPPARTVPAGRRRVVGRRRRGVGRGRAWRPGLAARRPAGRAPRHHPRSPRVRWSPGRRADARRPGGRVGTRPRARDGTRRRARRGHAMRTRSLLPTPSLRPGARPRGPLPDHLAPVAASGTQRRTTHMAASVLLAYPDDDVLAATAAVRAATPGLPAAVRERLDAFCDLLGAADLGDLRTRYVATFDLKRKCSMYLSYYAAGDT